MEDQTGHPMFSGNYMPHGMCFAWEPSILWTSIASDLLIATSYFSIPIAILLFFFRKPIKSYRLLFWLFAAFIFLCGLTHLFSIFTIFNGYYGFHALIKAATAVISFATAIAIYRILPLALSLPSPADLLKEKTTAAENALFKVLSDNSPVGLLLIDNQLVIKHINKEASRIFGYKKSDLIAKPVEKLVPQNQREIHATFMHQYLNNPKDSYNMNSGRVVSGLKKDGQPINVEISLSSGSYLGDQLTFVSVVDCQDKAKSENLLRQTLMKMDRIIDASDAGLWEWNLKTNEVWQSPRHLALIGLDSNIKPNFENWKNHIHPDYLDTVMDKVRESINQASDYFVEYLGKSESGRYEWFRSKGKLTLLDNDPVYFSGTIDNIDDEVKSKEAIKEKNEYLEKVTNRSINALYIYSFEDEENHYVNDEFENITGYNIDDIRELSRKGKYFDLFHPKDVNLVRDHLDKIKRSKEGELFSIQYRLKSINGHWIWCLSRDSVFSFHADGRAKEMLGTFIDISPIKFSENLQKKLKKDFQNTFDMAAVGVAHVALDGSWIKVNDKVCEILGYTRDELLKIDFQTITYPDDLNIDLDFVTKLIDGEMDNYDMEKRYITKTGEVVWANLTVAIVRDESNNPEYFISVLEDIGDRKLIEQEQDRLNEELKRSNEQLTRFAYSASHDMQEPLRKITSFSTSLTARLDSSQLDEQSKYELERISYSATRMKNMIDRLLELSRATKKTLNLAIESSRELIMDAQDQLSVTLEESKAKIEVMGDGLIKCDKVVIESVFSNLINNSIKYKRADKDPVIKILIEKHSNELTKITFCDNGIGFNEKYADEIFEPFKRLVSNSEVEGTGMGLAICHQLVALHHGSMSAKGKVDEGAVFTLILPSGGSNP